jgi:hypothetical protein
VKSGDTVSRGDLDSWLDIYARDTNKPETWDIDWKEMEKAIKDRDLKLNEILETPADAYKDFAQGVPEILTSLKVEVEKAADGNASVEYLEEKCNALQKRIEALKKNLEILLNS